MPRPGPWVARRHGRHQWMAYYDPHFGVQVEAGPLAFGWWPKANAYWPHEGDAKKAWPGKHQEVVVR